MKGAINKTDVFIIILYFVIAIAVTLGAEDLSDANTDTHNLNNILIDTLIYSVFTLLATYLFVFKLIPKLLPNQNYILMFFLTVGLFMLLGYLELNLYRWNDGRGLVKGPPLRILSWSLITTTQNAGLLIGILLGKKFYEAQIEISEREKQKREKELMLLKAQIDPHFLFNNLNTVDALIDKDPKAAKEYLNHLSQLYRYLIRTKDDEVVSLNEELEFAENYMYLIEKRFGTAYQFAINNLNNKQNQLVPPGALQTVLENVVKHNAANDDNPIITDVTITDTELIISNNIRSKQSKEESTGTGLKNLTARYELLTENKIKIEQSNRYTISLPILNPVD